MLHTDEVTREVNFEIRGNPWKLDRRAEALGTSLHRTDNALKKHSFPINKSFFIYIFIPKYLYNFEYFQTKVNTYFLKTNTVI